MSFWLSRRDSAIHLWSDEPGPVVRSMAEVFHDGILTDVVVFPIGFRIVAQAVIEKIILPVDSMVFGMESLPVADDAGHRCISRE